MYNIPLRVKNLISRHDSTNPLVIAKGMNVTVIKSKLPPNINGIWRRVLRQKYICVNAELAEEWQIRAVVAHEIAHILLHPDYKCYCIAGRTFVANRRYEDEANQFAAELLAFTLDIEKEYVLNFFNS